MDRNDAFGLICEIAATSLQMRCPRGKRVLLNAIRLLAQEKFPHTDLFIGRGVKVRVLPGLVRVEEC